MSHQTIKLLNNGPTNLMKQDPQKNKPTWSQNMGILQAKKKPKPPPDKYSTNALWHSLALYVDMTIFPAGNIVFSKVFSRLSKQLFFFFFSPESPYPITQRTVQPKHCGEVILQICINFPLCRRKKNLGKPFFPVFLVGDMLPSNEPHNCCNLLTFSIFYLQAGRLFFLVPVS